MPGVNGPLRFARLGKNVLSRVGSAGVLLLGGGGFVTHSWGQRTEGVLLGFAGALAGWYMVGQD